MRQPIPRLHRPFPPQSDWTRALWNPWDSMMSRVNEQHPFGSGLKNLEGRIWTNFVNSLKIRYTTAQTVRPDVLHVAPLTTSTKSGDSNHYPTRSKEMIHALEFKESGCRIGTSLWIRAKFLVRKACKVLEIRNLDCSSDHSPAQQCGLGECFTM